VTTEQSSSTQREIANLIGDQESLIDDSYAHDGDVMDWEEIEDDTLESSYAELETSHVSVHHL